MRKVLIALPLLGGLGAGAPAAAEEAALLLRPGEYRVTAQLELPHIKEKDLSNATTVDSICVTAGGTRGLVVLSDHNPLRKCPASNVARNGDTLTFDIVCAGSDAAIGSARYRLGEENFDGVIAVKMGGKNMTMLERQSGRRTGTCGQGRRSR